MSKQKAIICDLDGTLFNIDHRLKYIDGSLGKKKDWDKFHSEMISDPVNQWCHNMLLWIQIFNKNTIYDSLKTDIIFTTGRPEKYRETTEQELYKKVGINYKALYMRSEGDYRKSFLFKEDIYIRYIRDEYDILFCIDDNMEVCEMFRYQGLTCLECK